MAVAIPATWDRLAGHGRASQSLTQSVIKQEIWCVAGQTKGKRVLWQFSQQFSAGTKIFGMHEENSTSIANFDKSVFGDVSPDQNDRGPRRNGRYGPVILLGQYGSAPIF
jgi:hypothetical protein